jgi:hypothetical protein
VRSLMTLTPCDTPKGGVIHTYTPPVVMLHHTRSSLQVKRQVPKISRVRQSVAGNCTVVCTNPSCSTSQRFAISSSDLRQVYVALHKSGTFTSHEFEVTSRWPLLRWQKWEVCRNEKDTGAWKEGNSYRGARVRGCGPECMGRMSAQYSTNLIDILPPCTEHSFCLSGVQTRTRGQYEVRCYAMSPFARRPRPP